MAADVSCLVRILSRYKDDRTVLNNSAGQNSRVTLMTRDLLGNAGCVGGGGSDQSLELDLDLKVPNGWEKRLDLKSGKVYLQPNDSTKSSPHHHRREADQEISTLQDLNFPPITSKSPAKKPLLSLFDDTSLELNLFPSSSSSSSPNPSLSSSSTNSSVCTLDKVKSALERAEKEPSKKRNSPENSVCEDGNAAFSSCSPVAVGCSGCLSYVLVMKNNPKCPRCHSLVTLPPSIKKPKIDLNISI